MKGIRYLLKKLNDVNTKKKLLISYILLAFVPLLVVGIVLTTGMKNMALNQALNEASVNVERLETSISDVLKVPTDFSANVFLDKSLQTIVSNKYNTTMEVVEAYWQYTKFDDFIRLYSSIDNIMFYSVNNTIIENWRFMKASKEIMETPWYKDAVDKKGLISWSYIYNAAKNKYFLGMTRMVGTTSDPLGVLVIDMNSNYLYSIIKKEPFETIVVDDKGFVVLAKDTMLIGKMIDELNLGSDIIKEDSGIFQTKFQNRLSKVIVNSFYSQGSASKLKIYCVFSISSIVGKANGISLLGFSIIGASLLISLVFIIFFSDVLSKRIRYLSKYVHRVALGDFNLSSAIEGNDEVGQLSKDLNMMAKSIDKLVKEVHETSLQKNQLIIKQKEIKLKMLANQINPHFLFNTLETIRMKIHDVGEPETADVVALLGKIMRRNLEIGTELTTLTEEIDIVKSYLDIQKFRYEDKFNYTIDISEDVENCRIMPLTIQPIVENAAVHGLENMNNNGIIIINAKNEDGLFKISVIDNGSGMDMTKLSDIRKSLNETENDLGRRIGLKNVHQRIRLHYGDAYGLEISSEPGKGTQVDILLPGKGCFLC